MSAIEQKETLPYATRWTGNRETPRQRDNDPDDSKITHKTFGEVPSESRCLQSLGNRNVLMTLLWDGDRNLFKTLYTCATVKGFLW